MDKSHSKSAAATVANASRWQAPLPSRGSVIERMVQYHLNLISMRFSLHVARYYRKQYGLNVASWRVLAMLAEHEPLSAKEVSGMTVMNAFRVSRAIGLLEKLGYATRSLDQDDHRRVELRLTKKGRDMFSQVVPHLIESARELYAVLSDREYVTLEKIVAKLEARSIELFGAVPTGDMDGD